MTSPIFWSPIIRSARASARSTTCPRRIPLFAHHLTSLYMPPQAESLLIASSEQARELSPFADSGGGADIRPEKLSSWEVGFAQEFPKVPALECRLLVAALH